MAQPIVYIVIYSLYHHVYKMSLSVKEGLESKGVQVKMFQVAETLSDEVLTKMKAPPKPDLPIITIENIQNADGILFGLPTRFGTMPAQVKTFLDASGALWAKGALAGKFAGTFFSTASQHGGQETTALTAVTYFAHHGMMYVPFGFANSSLFSIDEVVGGSAYGAGTIADGDGSRQPTATELAIAKNQGENFASIVSTFVKGRDKGTSGPTGSATGVNSSTDPNLSNASAPIPASTNTTGNATTTATGANATNTSSSLGAAGGATAAGVTAIGAAVAGANYTGTDVSKIKDPAAGTANTVSSGAINTTDASKTTATGVSDTVNNTTTGTAGAATSTTNDASKIGAQAGAKAADIAEGTTPAQEQVLKKKENKKKKWFCCG